MTTDVKAEMIARLVVTPGNHPDGKQFVALLGRDQRLDL